MKKFYDIVGFPFLLAITLLSLSIVSKFFKESFTLIFILINSQIIGCIILSVIYKKTKIIIICILIILISTLFYIRIISFNNHYKNSVDEIFKSEKIVGYISEYPTDKNGKLTFKFKVVAIKYPEISDFKKISSFDILVKVKMDNNTATSNFIKGDKFLISKKISFPRERIFDFDYKEYLINNQVFGEVTVNNFQIEKIESQIVIPITDNNFISKIVYKWRESVIKKFKNKLSKNSFGFFMSIFLGIRDELDEDINRDFKNSGMLHLIAISGMHISFIGLFIFKIFNLFLSKSKSYIISISVLYLYILLLSYQPSSRRAFISYVIVGLFFIIGNKSGVLTSISYSAVILMFINPYSIFNLGFQFSYLATLGIILFNREINDMLPSKLPKKIKDTISVTLSAYTSIFLLQWSMFGKIAILPLISSILIIPAFELLFAELFFGAIFFYFTDFNLICIIMDYSISFFLLIINLSAKFPQLSLPNIPIFLSFLSIPAIFILLNFVLPLIKKYIKPLIFLKLNKT